MVPPLEQHYDIHFSLNNLELFWRRLGRQSAKLLGGGVAKTRSLLVKVFEKMPKNAFFLACFLKNLPAAQKVSYKIEYLHYFKVVNQTGQP